MIGDWFYKNNLVYGIFDKQRFSNAVFRAEREAEKNYWLFKADTIYRIVVGDFLYENGIGPYMQDKTGLLNFKEYLSDDEGKKIYAAYR